MTTDTALPDTSEEDTLENYERRARQAFRLAYARWLRARAAVAAKNADECESDPAEITKLVAEEDAALRAFLAAPATNNEQFVEKFEAVERHVASEAFTGQSRYAAILLGLGALKQDLANVS